MKRSVDVAVIGGGPAGLAAALKARAKGASVLVLERDAHAGGILLQCIHNGFGLHYFKEELTGPEYAGRFVKRVAGTAGIALFTDTTVLAFDADMRVHAVSAARGLIEIDAGAIVLAMGCRERTRGALNIPGSRPAGIFTAGCAQRLCNMEGVLPGRDVVVLGSGDIGLIMARRMAWEGANVRLVAELMPYSSGLNRNIVQCLDDNGIPLLLSHTVTRIHGGDRLTAVTIAGVDALTKKPLPGTERVVPCDTLLLSVGLLPENELSRDAGVLLSDMTGGAVVDERRETNLRGVFACGNALHVHDLVDHVSVEAEIAGASAAEHALSAERTAAGSRGVFPSGHVRYTVPQRIRADATGPVSLYFRVAQTVRPARLTVEADGRPLVCRKKQLMTPGEMEMVTVNVSNVTGDIRISVEEA